MEPDYMLDQARHVIDAAQEQWQRGDCWSAVLSIEAAIERLREARAQALSDAAENKLEEMRRDPNRG
jgi:hypothetical protein